MPFGRGRFISQSQTIRNHLVTIDYLGLVASHREGVKVNKGMVFVWLPAIVEKFWRDYLIELSRRFSNAPLISRHRSVGAATMFYFDSFSGLAASKKLKRWGGC